MLTAIFFFYFVYCIFYFMSKIFKCSLLRGIPVGFIRFSTLIKNLRLILVGDIVLELQRAVTVGMWQAGRQAAMRLA